MVTLYSLNESFEVFKNVFCGNIEIAGLKVNICNHCHKRFFEKRLSDYQHIVRLIHKEEISPPKCYDQSLRRVQPGKELRMLTLICCMALIWAIWRVTFVGIRLAWGITKILFSVIFLPVIVIGLLLAGLAYIALPAVIIIGLIALFTGKAAV